MYIASGGHYNLQLQSIDTHGSVFFLFLCYTQSYTQHIHKYLL